MTDTTSTLDRRCRATHPERIAVGDDVFVRDDIMAAKCGVTTRTQTRGDAHGAPFTFLGGVKYRPERAYTDFLLSQVQVRGRAKRQAARRDQRARRAARAEA